MSCKVPFEHSSNSIDLPCWNLLVLASLSFNFYIAATFYNYNFLFNKIFFYLFCREIFQVTIINPDSLESMELRILQRKKKVEERKNFKRNYFLHYSPDKRAPRLNASCNVVTSVKESSWVWLPNKQDLWARSGPWKKKTIS